MALYIADSDKCLKKYVYKEAIDNGFTYGIIEFYDFYMTIVKYNETFIGILRFLMVNMVLKIMIKIKRVYLMSILILGVWLMHLMENLFI